MKGPAETLGNTGVAHRINRFTLVQVRQVQVQVDPKPDAADVIVYVLLSVKSSNFVPFGLLNISFVFMLSQYDREDTMQTDQPLGPKSCYIISIFFSFFIPLFILRPRSESSALIDDSYACRDPMKKVFKLLNNSFSITSYFKREYLSNVQTFHNIYAIVKVIGIFFKYYGQLVERRVVCLFGGPVNVV